MPMRDEECGVRSTAPLAPNGDSCAPPPGTMLAAFKEFSEALWRFAETCGYPTLAERLLTEAGRRVRVNG